QTPSRAARQRILALTATALLGAIGSVPAQNLEVAVTGYGTATGVPAATAATMVLCANATPGQQVEFDVRVPGGAGKTAALLVGLSAASAPVPPGVVLVNPLLWSMQQLDASGATRFSMALPNAVGSSFYVQAVAADLAN